MYVIAKYENVTTTLTTTVGSATATKVSPVTPNAHRQGYRLTNTDPTYTLYVLETNSDSVPSFSAAAGWNFALAPLSSIPCSAGSAVRVWAINSTSPTANTTCTFTELA